jgi:hypothetical protein
MRYRPIFSDSAVVSFAALSRSRQRRLLDRSRELAADPFVAPDLRRTDEDGREIGDIFIDDFLLSYWVDHSAKAVMIVELEDVS